MKPAPDLAPVAPRDLSRAVYLSLDDLREYLGYANVDAARGWWRRHHLAVPRCGTERRFLVMRLHVDKVLQAHHAPESVLRVVRRGGR